MSRQKTDDLARDAERPLMLKEEAYIALERMIVTGRLAPGQWVSETQLIAASGYGRASVRSAVQRLQDQELIQIFPRRGAQICPVDHKRQFRAQELRRAVETLLARSAAERANQLQRTAFADIAERFREQAVKKDQTAMTELDLRCHSLLLKAADNPFAAKAMSSVKGLSRRFWILHHETHGDIAQMAQSHAAVAEAISAGEPQAAEDAVHAMVDYVERFTLRVVGYSGALTAAPSSPRERE